MAYLTYEEAEAYNLDEIGEDEFNRLLARATVALDGATRGYYRSHDLAADPVRRRAEDFKHALALTIHHMHATGIETEADAAAMSLTSVSVGQTSLSGGSNAEPVRVVPAEAEALLAGVGLLYRGIGYGWGWRGV